MELIPGNKEVKIRKFCYKMYLKRLYLLNNVRASSAGEMVAPSIGDMFMFAFRCTDAHQFLGFLFYYLPYCRSRGIE